ncbi:hypothetical protein EDB92DRAFT_2107213 [Lactarius akahatsu]|uniref:Uncharacterized protein n=1 Tax=Lactarius akahatsu TaxID=416441 RepID=A0AAD4L940_9AGAM|nr:hypothetical protein EDB92DRAFT_2107213 [Lactarius akahatsu]
MRSTWGPNCSERDSTVLGDCGRGFAGGALTGASGRTMAHGGSMKVSVGSLRPEVVGHEPKEMCGFHRCDCLRVHAVIGFEGNLPGCAGIIDTVACPVRGTFNWVEASHCVWSSTGFLSSEWTKLPRRRVFVNCVRVLQGVVPSITQVVHPMTDWKWRKRRGVIIRRDVSVARSPRYDLTAMGLRRPMKPWYHGLLGSALVVLRTSNIRVAGR